MTPRRPRETRAAAPRRRAALLSAVETLEPRCLLATFTVNALVDAAALNPASGDATSTLGAGMITLRSAIQAADATSGPSTITLPAGTYPLTIPTSGADGPDVGDLNITGALTITGAGAATTIISAQFGNTGGRVLSVDGGVAALSGVTITGGKTTQFQANNGQGGGIRIKGGGLTLTDAIVSGNTVNDYGGLGGGIYADSGTLSLTRTTVANNKADPSRGTQGGGGGGIYSNNGTVTLVDSTVNNNQVNENEYGGFGGGKGGGIFVSAGTLNATGSTVRDNNAGHDYGGIPANPSAGGGVYALKSQVLLSKTAVVTGNIAGQGGGIALSGSSLDMSDGTLGGNTGEAGGGIYNATGRVSLTRVNVLNNAANNPAGTSAGGGIYNASDGALIVLSSSVANNQLNDSNGGGASGGGIANYGGSLTLTNSTVRDNNTGNEYGGGPGINTGGGVYNTGQATILDSTLSGNASTHGGGIENLGGTLALTDVTVSGNTARDNGGGIEFAPPVVILNLITAFVVQPASSVDGSTIANNIAGTGGAGIYFNDTKRATIKNTILAKNLSNAFTNNYEQGTNGAITSLGHNLSTDGTAAAVLNAAGDLNSVPDAKLGPLAANGGPTLTYALLAGSPALGAGDPSGAPATDQRGLPRVVNGTIDIGAFEVQGAAVKATRTTLSSSRNPSALGQSVTFTAVVKTTEVNEIGGSADTVTFTIDNVRQTPTRVQVVNGLGQATLTKSFFSAGKHTVVAAYSGGVEYGPSTSDPLTQTVKQAATRTTLTSSPNPSAFGHPVTFTAEVLLANLIQTDSVHARQTVLPTGFPPFSGSVTFLDGSNVIGTAPVRPDGSASFTTSSLTPGHHTITAVFGKDANFADSTSAAVDQRVIGAIAGPRVLLVQRYGYHQSPTTLVVLFDGPLDAASAQATSNYRITDAHGELIPVVSAFYSAASHTVTLSPLSSLDLHKRYTLTINGSTPGGVKGATGSLLDGTLTGRAGSDYVTVVDAADLVVTNPFASGATAALRYAARVRAADARAAHHRR